MRLAADEYRAKAFECLSLAECMNDPERRADMLRLAKMWMSLAEPLGDMPGAYEFPQNDSVMPQSDRHTRYGILSRSRNMTHQSNENWWTKLG